MRKLLIISFLIIFTACGGYDNTGDTTTPQPVTPDTLESQEPQEREINSEDYERFNEMFFDIFDTLTIILGYATTQEEFNYFANDVIREELNYLHKLFDRFNEHEGINNIYTINQSAGIQPVEVSEELIEVLKFGIYAYQASYGMANIAIGPVTDIWREQMQASTPTVPDMEELRQAAELTDINNVIIDEQNNTVFLKYEGMSLDVGALAKGYAVEHATQKAIDAGFVAFTISMGGDVRTVNAPLTPGRTHWGVGILNPDNPDNQNEHLDAVFVTDNSVFTSGDYQRFFIIDGVRYHHIIDPNTLMPGNNFRSVTVIYPDAGMADLLTTIAFLLELDDAKRVLAEYGAEALWVLQDGSVVTTDGYEGRNF